MDAISQPKVILMGSTLAGAAVLSSRRSIQDLKGLFEDQEAFDQLRQSKTVYEVDSYFPVSDGTEGGLFFGITRIQPGLVGEEYFMTKGHLHSIENRGEFYWGIGGEGMLILMDKDRNTRAEKMHPGSVHYISGSIAHRVANTDTELLTFGACWPADAGHNYEQIAQEGFSKRLKEVDGFPQLV